MANNFSDYEDLLNAYAARTDSNGADKHISKVDYDPHTAKMNRKKAARRPMRRGFTDSAKKRSVESPEAHRESDDDIKIAPRRPHNPRTSGYSDISSTRFRSDFDDVLSELQGDVASSDTTVFRSTPQRSHSENHSKEVDIGREGRFNRYKEKIAKTARSANSGISALFKDAKAKNLVIYFSILAVFIIICSIWAMSCVNDVLAMNRSGDAVKITISTQVDTNDVLKILKKNKLIKNKGFCKMFVKFRDYSDEYQTGEFYLRPDMGVEGMLLALKATSTTDETVSVTFPEGFSAIDIANTLEEKGVCSSDVFLQTLASYKFDYNWLDNSLMDDENKIEYLEGYLFPDTYDFFIGESPSSVIKKLLNGLNQKITKEDTERCKKLGMTFDEVIILASIIQKEAANSSQMATISSVLHNRLNNISSFPKLECDSTTTYLKDDGKKLIEKLSKTDKDMKPLSYYTEFYDTYGNGFAGLPAGAICSPGYDAIKAALNPKKTNYYYFAHDKNGKLYTAATLSEHERNLRNIKYAE